MKNSCNVYAVDDDPAVLLSLKAVLGASGFEPQCCLSAGELLPHITPDQIGCVITDLQMPGMGGRELMQQLKTSAPFLSVIIVTGFADVALAVRLMEEGALTLLEKPYSVKNLVEAVHRGLRQSQAKFKTSEYRRQALEKLQSLTLPERVFLEKALAGHADSGVCITLDMEQSTFEQMKDTVLRKMGATSLIELSSLFAITGHSVDRLDAT